MARPECRASHYALRPDGSLSPLAILSAFALRWGIAMAALFDPTMRAVKEQLYQSERPWVVDSTRFERTFGWTATPSRDAVAATVAWFRNSTAT